MLWLGLVAHQIALRKTVVEWLAASGSVNETGWSCGSLESLGVKI